MCVTPVSFSPDFFDILKFLYSLLCATLKEGAISSLKEWLSDSAIGSNPVPRLIAGIIFMQEQDYTRGCQAHTYRRNSGHVSFIFPYAFRWFNLSLMNWLLQIRTQERLLKMVYIFQFFSVPPSSSLRYCLYIIILCEIPLIAFLAHRLAL